MANELHVNNAEARAALSTIADRTAGLFESARDSKAPVRRSAWTVGEVGAHISVALYGFTEAVDGHVEAVGRHIPASGLYDERLRAVTAGTLNEEPERDPISLARLIRDRTAAFLSASAGVPGTISIPTPWYGEGASLPLATATAMLVGEQLVHGYDIAQSIHQPWSISIPEAHLVLRAVTAMMPLAYNPQAVADLDATYAVRVRGGGPRFAVQVRGGTVAVESYSSGRADCHLSADGLTLLLVGYGRISQWGPIARGKLRAWGRRPWLAFGFKDLFFNP